MLPLPDTVGAPSARAAASSSDGPDGLQLAVAGPAAALDADETYALQQIHFQAGFAGEVRPISLLGVSSATIQRLKQRGAILQRQDEFLDQQICLAQDNLVLTPSYELRECVPCINVLRGGDQLKLPKYYHIFRLLEDGWEGVAPVGPYTLAGNRHFTNATSRPVSYFIALRAAESIFNKHVDSIKHDGKYVYYKALLRLPEQELLKVLPQLEAKGLAWLKSVLKKHKGRPADEASTDDSGSDDDPVPAPVEIGNAVVPYQVPDRIHWSDTQWRRTWVTIGGLSTRVYFDNCSDTSGKRRGWSNCSKHGFGCIRFVTVSRDYFAVAMLLWLKEGLESETMTKQTHLQAWPPADADVKAQIPNAIFEEFWRHDRIKKQTYYHRHHHYSTITIIIRLKTSCVYFCVGVVHGSSDRQQQIINNIEIQ